MDWKIEACASAAHEVNRRYCISIGDNTQPHWEDALYLSVVKSMWSAIH